MKTTSLAAGAYLLAAGFAVKWLWTFWTSLCNEACPEVLVVAIYLIFAAVVLGSVVISALTALGKLSLKISLLGFAAFAAVVSTSAALLTRALNA